MTECNAIWLALLLLSLALLASLSLNIIFCLVRQKHKDHNSSLCRGAAKSSLSQDEEEYLSDSNNHVTEENHHSVHLQQENPIYGNIIKDTGSIMVYEAMTRNARSCIKPAEPDLNYASLDLKMATKRKRKLCHQQQGQTPVRNNLLDQLPGRLTPPEEAFLEEVDACLPPRDNSPMMSHSSIYLNSQQIAQEAQEVEGEDNEKTDNWQTTQEESTSWIRGQQSEDIGSREECVLPDEQTIQSNIFNLNPDGDQERQ